MEGISTISLAEEKPPSDGAGAEMRKLINDASKQLDVIAKDLSHPVLSNEEIRGKYTSVLGDVQCVIIDLDGTLYDIGFKDTTETPGAVAAFNHLKSTGIKVLLVVNTWLKSKKQLLELVQKIGFSVEENEIFTSSDCCKIFMENHSLKHPFLLVSNEALNDFEGMETTDPFDFDSVVVGLPSTMIDYRLMTKTFNLIFEGCPLLVLHAGKWEKSIKSISVSAPGPFAQTLEYATDAKKYVPAKPTVGFYIEACKYAGFLPQECLMIGDEIVDDVRDSKAIGMKAALVQTGKYKPKDENKFCSFSPDLVAQDFATVVRFLLCAKSKEPVPDAEEVEEALRKARLAGEQNDFNMRLAAYANDYCLRKGPICPPKMPSFIW